jgi:hypothetical protein
MPALNIGPHPQQVKKAVFKVKVILNIRQLTIKISMHTR